MKVVCQFIVLLLSAFSPFTASFSFAFGNFAYYCVVLLNTLLSDQDKKKYVAMGYFLWEILIHHHWRQKVLLSHWLVVSGGKKISWHRASCLQIFMSLTHAFDFGRNTTPLSKFIEYIDSTHYCHISPKHSKKNDKEKCREISIFEICVLWRPFTKHASHILSYSNLRCRYLDNQSE